MSDLIEMPTKNGESIKLTAIADDLLTLAIPAVVQSMKDKLPLIRDATHKDGDVLICSYPKSGTHWMRGILNRLVETQMEESDKVKHREQSARHLELAPIEFFQNAMAPRIAPTHLRPNRIPSYFLEGTGKVVLMLRNPKDVAVSYFYHLRNTAAISNKQDWSEYVESFRKGHVPIGSCFDYYKAWETEIRNNKTLDIEVFYYEDLKTNGLECTRRLAKHLGLSLSDEALQSVLDSCSLTNLKKEDAKNIIEKEAKPTNTDGQSVIFRKGNVADWKNHFTLAQNEVFDQQIKEVLQNSMFHFRYE